MSWKRALPIFLIGYIAANLVYASQKTVLVDPDGASRGMFAVMAKEITQDIASSRSFSAARILRIVKKYNAHYQVGLEPLFVWTPLQLSYLYPLSFIPLDHEFVFALTNLAFLILLAVFIYKLAYLTFENEGYALISSILFLLHPIVFDTAISLRRGMGETAFLTAASYCFVVFLKTRSIRAFLDSLIIALIGFFYRETMLLPVVAICALGVFVISRNIPWPEYAKGFLRYRGRLSVIAVLCLILFLYLSSEIYMTKKGVGTLLTKGKEYNSQRVKNVAVKGLVTMDDYFKVESVYAPLRFDRNLFEKMEQTQPEFYSKIRLIESRFGIPHYKKSFFIASTIFYQWYLLPFFIIGIIAARKAAKIRYASGFILFSALLYFAALSLTGTIPDFSLPMIPAVMIFCTLGIFEVAGNLNKYLKAALFCGLFFIITISGLYALQNIQLHQRMHVRSSLVISDILKDNSGGAPFTLMVDSYVAPEYGLRAVQMDKAGVMYLLPVSAFTLKKDRLADCMKRKGLNRRSGFLGDISCPGIEYIAAFSEKQYDYYNSIISPAKMPFNIDMVISEPSAATKTYIYKRNDDYDII
ncbi:MAG: hypothetical protein PHT32_00130 [Candidatus Omnitrophica bacterium]|nr:hypothetical protein [Candidatus Omnitrophota bacterium]